MAIQFITATTRPSTDVPWTNLSNNESWFMNDAYFLLNWHEKGKLLSTTLTVSEDGLTLHMVREFIDWEALDDFIADTNLIPARQLRTEYYESVGIEITNLETVQV